MLPPRATAELCATAREASLACYLDGARLPNAAVACCVPLSALSAGFDLVSVSLSKGLGAPMGAMLAGRSELIKQAVRQRRMLGGALRQAGLMAACGVFALKHNMNRLAEDHANARALAERLAEDRRILVEPDRVVTNIVLFEVKTGRVTAPHFVEMCRRRGVLLMALSSTMLRVVTHLDVDREACLRAAEVMRSELDGMAGEI